MAQATLTFDLFEVKNDSTLNRRKFIIESDEFFGLNLQNPFCVDSLEYW